MSQQFETAFKLDAFGLYAEQVRSEELDFGYDWGPWLAQAGEDAVAASAWVASANLTIADGSPQFNTTHTSVIVRVAANAPVGEELWLSNLMTTSARGLKREKSFRIKVVERRS